MCGCVHCGSRDMEEVVGDKKASATRRRRCGGRELVGWQTWPVVVTVPAAASGTIWPLWKNLVWSDIRAGLPEWKKKSRMKK